MWGQSMNPLLGKCTFFLPTTVYVCLYVLDIVTYNYMSLSTYINSMVYYLACLKSLFVDGNQGIHL